MNLDLDTSHDSDASKNISIIMFFTRRFNECETNATRRYTILKYIFNVLGFHQRWNTKLHRRHPSLWIFLRQLKDEQRLVEVNTRAESQGTTEEEVEAPGGENPASQTRLQHRGSYASTVLGCHAAFIAQFFVSEEGRKRGRGKEKRKGG